MTTLLRAAWIILLALPFPGSECIVPEVAPRPQSRNTQQSDFTIKSNTVLVTVDAVVRNAKGGFVGNLTADDFIVFDNGVAQQISMFSREELPLAVALVVDRSPSIRPYLEELRAAALTALQRLRPEDQVALFSFAMIPAQLSELTRDHRLIAQMIGESHGGVGTNICDALYDAAQYLHEKAPDRRHAIILVSDNYQSVPSEHNIKDTLREMLEAGATLYSIKTQGDNPGSANAAGEPKEIARLTEETGGEVINADSTEKLPEALEAAVTNLKQGYTLGFAPSDAREEGSYHRLQVRLNPRTSCSICKVMARSGYYVGGYAPTTLEARDRNSKKATPGRSRQPFDLEETIAQSRIGAARVNRVELEGINFRARILPLSDAKGNPLIQVDLSIDPAPILFSIADGLHTGRLRITVFQQDASDRVLAGDWKVMDMRLREETYQRVMRAGIPYSVTLPRKAQKQRLKIVVYDPWSDSLGSRLIALQ